MTISGRVRILGLIAGLAAGVAQASLVIPMQWTSGPNAGKLAGIVKADDTPYGLLLTPSLKGFSPGTHGFHLHAIPLCDEGGMAAGGHFDPERTNLHQGPYRGNGHLGDLPILIVNEKGEASLPVLAPRLKLSMITGHALIIHQGTDDYSVGFMKLPNAMVRVACGPVPWH